MKSTKLIPVSLRQDFAFLYLNNASVVLEHLFSVLAVARTGGEAPKNLGIFFKSTFAHTKTQITSERLFVLSQSCVSQSAMKVGLCVQSTCGQARNGHHLIGPIVDTVTTERMKPDAFPATGEIKNWLPNAVH